MSKVARHVASSFSGGVNTTSDPDSVQPNELRRAENAREHEFGGVQKIGGTKRIHDTSLGASVNGVFQWDAPGQPRQVVATAGGNFYWKNESASDFNVVAAGLSTTQRTQFILHHENGVPVLYLADGVGYYSWDGTVLFSVTYNYTPFTLTRYKSRVFVTKGDKFLDYTAVDKPEEFSQVQGGGTAAIETYDSSGMTNLFVLGDSLICCKPNSIARFTLYDTQVPEIDQGTDGISNDVGLIARDGWAVFENVALIVSDRGPYLVTDQGAREIGRNIEYDFNSNTNALAVHNRRRREVWVFTDGDTMWCYNYRSGSWWGPSGFSFSVASACKAENADGTETVFVGGSDGFVRNADTGTMDDVNRDGTETNASRIQMKLVIPRQYFGDPSAIKKGNNHQFVRADLQVSGSLQVEVSSEQGTWEAQVRSYGPGEHDYRLRPYFRGRGIDVSVIEGSRETTSIYSVDLHATVESRTG